MPRSNYVAKDYSELTKRLYHQWYNASRGSKPAIRTLNQMEVHPSLRDKMERWAAKLGARAAELTIPAAGTVTYDYDLVRHQGWVELHDEAGRFRGICHPTLYEDLLNDEFDWAALQWLRKVSA